MNAMDLLLSRYSSPRLSEPAPKGEALLGILQAALNVPDHGALRPWRFIQVSGDGLKRLGDMFAHAAQRAGESGENAAQSVQRAPLILIVVASPREHNKVPQVEQLISAGCCVHAMQMAALAQGYQGMWRTGAMAYNDEVKLELGLNDNESIVGFLYLGSSEAKIRPRPALKIDNYLSVL